MGLTYLTIRVSNPGNKKRIFKRRFLIDSGAVYSVIDSQVLKKMGIKPHSKREFILANGEVIKKEIGDAFFVYSGQKASAPVVFGDKNIFLLGATTLENLGLILNPLDRRLLPLPMVI